MTPSIKGGMLPDSPQDYRDLEKRGALRHELCTECGQPFGPKNTYSAAGWRDTQIIGMCKVCFDELFDEEGED